MRTVTNAAYQAVIRELEQVLPPRVVSRSLKEGLVQLGRSPEDVTLSDLESLLRGPVLRQLQALMPLDKASDTVTRMLDRILDPGARLLHSTPAFEQKVRNDLAELNAALRPFNLYFEWPEVQKLRAQLQLIEEELDTDGDVAELLAGSRDQLDLLRQKLEDQLVLQAGELAQLEEALERLSSLGGPRVRRLDNLITRIREAQQQRELMPAEIDRARLLSVDLRKLLESSVYSTVDPESELDIQATLTLLPEEVNERLKKLDLENEAHRLDQLQLQHGNLLESRDDLARRLITLRQTIVGGESAADGITALELSLNQAFSQERAALTRELGAMAADTGAMGTPVGSGQLRQALQVANGILATTLPDPGDIMHIRNLFELAREQLEVMKRTLVEGTDMASARRLAELELDGRQSLLNELFQLEQELRRLPAGTLPELDDLTSDLQLTRTRLSEGDVQGENLDGFWQRLEDIRSSLNQRLDSIGTRTREAQQTLAQVERLNSEDVATVRRILQHLTAQLERLPQLSLSLKLQLDASLLQAEELLEKLKGEFEATRNIADQLVSANILDDLLGGASSPVIQDRDASRSDSGATGPPAQLASGNELLDELLRTLATERGVEQLLLLRGDKPLGGTFTASVAALVGALSDLERDVKELGASLQNGALQLLTLELGGRILAVAWPAANHRLLVIVGVPATLSLVLYRVRQQLGGLHGLLDGSADAD